MSSENGFDACAIAMDVNARQKYLFEADKLQEILGASRIIVDMKEEAERLFAEECGFHLFSPVSGEIKVWALIERRKELLERAWKLRLWMEDKGLSGAIAYLETFTSHFLENGDKLQTRILDASGFPEGDTPNAPDLSWVHWALETILRVQKDSPAGEDNRPTSSLFAECRIHGDSPANYWECGDGAKSIDERRRLTGWRAKAKWKAWKDESTQLFATLVEALKPDAREADKKSIVEGLRNDVDQFAGSEGDSYVAFSCADGDGMGELLSNLSWNDEVWETPDQARKNPPWKRNRDFVEEYDNLVHAAFKSAVQESQKETGFMLSEDKKHVRILPQLLGGDDVWMLGARDSIADLCPRFIAQYENLAKEGEPFATLRKALEIATTHRNKTGAGEVKPKLRFTVSMGLAFTKAGFPLNKSIAYAEGLMKSAKTYRKSLDVYTGCVDWHWVESSKYDSVVEVRDRSLRIGTAENTGFRHLTTRPWTNGEFGAFIQAARTFQGIPRVKREQLESILREERLEISNGKWTAWLGKLTEDQKKLCGDVVEQLPKRLRPLGWENSPWNEDLSTPFLDILALQHVFGLEGSLNRATTQCSKEETGR